MEDTSSLPVHLPSAPSNNLLNINTAFQDYCLPTLLSITTPCMILCDFPSRIPHPPPHISIYGLEDFSLFLNAALSQHQSKIYVLTQSILHLRKLLFKPCPLTRPFTFFTRSSNSAPDELKIVEIFNSLPNDTFGKITSLQSLLTFPTTLTGKKGPWIKHFDLFLLILDPSASVSSIQLPVPDFYLHGIMFDGCAETLAQASESLVHHNIPHTLQNTIQAKFLSHTESLCYKLPIHDAANFEAILDTLSSITFLKSFNFTSMLAALFNSSSGSSINFASLKNLQPATLIEVFEHCNLPYLLTYNSLIFKATTTQIEEAILSAPDINVTIPPSFLNSAKRLIFQCNNDVLSTRLFPLCESGVIELQVARLDIGTSSDTFFEPSFLSFIRSRFHVLTQPQLCTVRNFDGEIREVLSLTSSTDLFNTITRDSLPLPFVHNGMNFALSFLQPLFQQKPRPITSYPFETQEEHYQRFQNTSDSLASRIPLLTPHSQYGGPLANDIITSPLLPFLGTLRVLLPSYFPPHPLVFSFLLPHLAITSQTPSLISSPKLVSLFIPFPFMNLHCTRLILSSLKSPPANLFIYPTFHRDLPVSPPLDGSCKSIFLIQSVAHFSLITKYLKKHLTDSSITITIGVPSHVSISLDPNSPVDPVDDIIMDAENPIPYEDPTLLPHSPLLLLCYGLLSYFAWPKDFDHPRQRLLNCVDFSPPLTPLSLFNKLSIGLPDSVLNALFPTTLPAQSAQRR